MIIKEWILRCQDCNKSRIITNDVITKCPECGSKLKFGDKLSYSGISIQHSDKRKIEIINDIIDYCDKKNYWINVYHGIVEMGYEDKMMITADWNPPKMEKIYKFLEKFEDILELDWSDEWTNCSDCNKAVRTSPDSYGWERSYIMGEHDLVCHECITEDINFLIDTYKNTTDRAIPSWAKPLIIEEGFTCLEDLDYEGKPFCERFETGWHSFQTDDPEKVIKKLKEELGELWFDNYIEYIFAINSVGQFDVHWSVYVRSLEDEEQIEKETKDINKVFIELLNDIKIIKGVE